MAPPVISRADGLGFPQNSAGRRFLRVGGGPLDWGWPGRGILDPRIGRVNPTELPRLVRVDETVNITSACQAESPETFTPQPLDLGAVHHPRTHGTLCCHADPPHQLRSSPSYPPSYTPSRLHGLLRPLRRLPKHSRSHLYSSTSTGFADGLQTFFFNAPAINAPYHYFHHIAHLIQSALLH